MTKLQICRAKPKTVCTRKQCKWFEKGRCSMTKGLADAVKGLVSEA